MKKIIVMAFAASIFSLNTQAQVTRKFDSTQNTQKHMKRGNSEGMNWQALNLTADQKTQFQKNQEAFRSQREAVRNDATLTPDQKKTKMQEIQKASREKTSSLLTAEQKATLKANRNDKGHMDKGKAKGKAKGRMDMNLTPDQKAKMQTIRTDMKSEMDKIKNDTSLSGEQKKDQMSSVQTRYKEKMSQILTPEQQLKMKDQKGKMKNDRMKKNK